MPGVETRLAHLNSARNVEGEKIYIALASSSEKNNFELKTSRHETKEIFSVIDENRRILGDDPKLQNGRGKPAPDIFLLALQVINESLGGKKVINPSQCLAFEDSVSGVEAGGRAGMRVVWGLHLGLAAEYEKRDKEVLAGRTGLVPIGDEWQLGKVDDGWAVILPNPENFLYDEYQIRVIP